MAGEAGAGMGGIAGTAGTGGSAGTSGLGGAGAGGTGGRGGGGRVGRGGRGGSAGSGGAGGTSCSEITVPVTMFLINDSAAPSTIVYYYAANAVGGADADYLAVEFWDGGVYDGGATGTFTLGTPDDDNYATCSRCVWGLMDAGSGTPVYFFASSGQMTVADTSDQMNRHPDLLLSDVTLVEVTIAAGGVSTPVPDGRCWHVASAPVEFPKDWTCDDSYYTANDGCDCGCGALDGDCEDATGSSCNWCYCPGDVNNCSTTSVDPSDNSQCL
jgi:hypothetical protein